MEHHLSKLLFVILSSLSIYSYAGCNRCGDQAHFVSCPKTYIASDQIDFHENSIFVKINDVVLQTQSLNTDDDGIYFENVRDSDCGFAQWKCDKSLGRGLTCNACNWIWDNDCYACGQDKNSKKRKK